MSSVDYRELLKGVLGELAAAGDFKLTFQVESCDVGTPEGRLTMLLWNAKVRAFSPLPKTPEGRQLDELVEKVVVELLGPGA